MVKRKIRWGRIAAALAIGYSTEAIVFLGLATKASSPGSQPRWFEWAFVFTQEPGRHIAYPFVMLIRPGFEEGPAYFFLFTSIIQGFVYALVVYLVLVIFRRKQSDG